MSTYTDIHTRVSETLAVDADPYSRTTTQKARFRNEENEYWGTFRGAVQASTLAVEDRTLSGMNILNSCLYDSFVANEDGTYTALADMAKTCESIDGSVMERIKRAVAAVESFDARLKSLEGGLEKLRCDMNAADRELHEKINEHIRETVK